MRILAVCLTGCILDFVLGDPYWLYHPVRLIGALIAKCDRSAGGAQTDPNGVY